MEYDVIYASPPCQRCNHEGALRPPVARDHPLICPDCGDAAHMAIPISAEDIRGYGALINAALLTPFDGRQPPPERARELNAVFLERCGLPPGWADHALTARNRGHAGAPGPARHERRARLIARVRAYLDAHPELGNRLCCADFEKRPELPSLSVIAYKGVFGPNEGWSVLTAEAGGTPYWQGAPRRTRQLKRREPEYATRRP